MSPMKKDWLHYHKKIGHMENKLVKVNLKWNFPFKNTSNKCKYVFVLSKAF